MRLSIALLLTSLAGVLLGAALIGIAALGGAVIFDSLLVGVYALNREYGEGHVRSPRLEGVSLPEVLERARRAS